MARSIDISEAFTCVEGLPRPQWDAIQASVEGVSTEDEDELWTEIARQWLEHLSAALGEPYIVIETANFLLLLDGSESAVQTVPPFAEACRRALATMLAGVAEFPGPGKAVLLVLENAELYYQYVSAFHPDGRFGSSGGMQIRQGYPHVVTYGMASFLQPTIAHELMHASLSGLTLPAWVEEGLAQMFEHDMAGHPQLLVTGEMARKHKKYWNKNGLAAFWSGEGFLRPGKVQELSYQLAEILVRLLIEEHRPGWFSRQRAKQERLFAFLGGAVADDCGEASALDNLGFSLASLAQRFLGHGDWSPSRFVADDTVG